MTRGRGTLAAVAAMAALGGCSRPGEGDPDRQALPDIALAASDRADDKAEDGPEGRGEDGAGPPLVAIPEQMRGRWGLVPADCTSTRGDTKGLIEVGPDTLRFYEAKAQLGPISEGGPERIRASFAFTGEGMEWSRDELLALKDHGTALVRREFGEDALPAALTYHRC